jgi:uncharacterized small protein (DUF1192 family)
VARGAEGLTKQLWEYSKEELAERLAIALSEIEHLNERIKALETALLEFGAR